MGKKGAVISVTTPNVNNYKYVSSNGLAAGHMTVAKWQNDDLVKKLIINLGYIQLGPSLVA